MSVTAETICSNLNYSVILTEKPSRIERFAAEESKYVLEKLYSKDIVVNGASAPVNCFIGIGDEAINAGFTKKRVSNSLADDRSESIGRKTTFYLPAMMTLLIPFRNMGEPERLQLYTIVSLAIKQDV